MKADWDHIRELMRRVAETGDGWQEMLTALEPVLVQLARRQPIGRLRESEDSPSEIVTRVVARLHANDHATIKRMFAESPPPHPRAWIRVLVRRSAIDYMRSQPEYVRGTGADEPRWITVVSLVTGDGISDPDTLAQKRREVIAFVTAAVERAVALASEVGDDDAISQLALEWEISRTHVRRLIRKGRKLVDVLYGVLEGLGHAEVGERVALTRREVQLHVGYIEELLEARRFGAPG